MSLFDNVKYYSLQRGLSLKELAKRAGLSENAIYKWKTQRPQDENILKVAGVLHLSYEELTDESREVEQDDQIQYFRIDTAGLDEAQVKKLRKSLEKYAEFAKHELEDD
ncbi:helix-turn-helix domain-containing protein [Lacticaseibacillus saniviri]|uniref:helix-turn-helix domain-containing protein n=1 Tax=Lacticaseibacillus saniviri TaxID=931533 RepID=UPI0006D007A7|nr:helix-turn-helix transcriptional regulator [Lacticaseibacillus saniviri]